MNEGRQKQSLESPAVQAPVSKAALGLNALRLLSERIASSRAAQFVHVYEDTDDKYVITHHPEKCAVCGWFNAIEAGLVDALTQAALPTPESASDGSGVGGLG